MLKMFVNHIIKTPARFGHSCLTIFREPFFVLSAVTTSLLVCVVKLTTQTSRELVTALSTENGPLKMVKQE